TLVIIHLKFLVNLGDDSGVTDHLFVLLLGDLLKRSLVEAMARVQQETDRLDTLVVVLLQVRLDFLHLLWAVLHRTRNAVVTPLLLEPTDPLELVNSAHLVSEDSALGIREREVNYHRRAIFRTVKAALVLH